MGLTSKEAKLYLDTLAFLNKLESKKKLSRVDSQYLYIFIDHLCGYCLSQHEIVSAEKVINNRFAPEKILIRITDDFYVNSKEENRNKPFSINLIAFLEGFQKMLKSIQ